MSRVVGIDLGTTNSLVAFVKDGAPVVIRDKSGDALVPSVVSIGDGGTVFVGREAQRRLLTYATRTVYSVKRFMGRSDEHGEYLAPSGNNPASVTLRFGVECYGFKPFRRTSDPVAAMRNRWPISCVCRTIASYASSLESQVSGIALIERN